MSDNSPNTEKPDFTDTPEVMEPVDDANGFSWWEYMAFGGLIVAIISAIIISCMNEYNDRSHQNAYTNMVTVKGGLDNVTAFNEAYAVSIDNNGNIHTIGVDASPDKEDTPGPGQDGNYSVYINRDNQKGNWLTEKSHDADMTYIVTVNTENGNMSPHCTILDSTGKVLAEKSASNGDISVTCKYTEHVNW